MFTVVRLTADQAQENITGVAARRGPGLVTSCLWTCCTRASMGSRWVWSLTGWRGRCRCGSKPDGSVQIPSSKPRPMGSTDARISEPHYAAPALVLPAIRQTRCLATPCTALRCLGPSLTLSCDYMVQGADRYGAGAARTVEPRPRPASGAGNAGADGSGRPGPPARRSDSGAASHGRLGG